MRASKKLPTAGLFAIVFLGLVAASCNSVKDVNQTILTATDTLKSTANQLGQDLQGTAQKIDPIGVKKLLDQNEELRLQLIKLQEKTQLFGPSVGIIQLSGARLLLRIQSYRGDFSVFAYTDDKTNWILNPLTLAASNAARIDAATPIPLNAEEAIVNYFAYAHLPNDPIHTASNSWGVAEFAINRYAIPKIKSFIASSVNALPSREIDLQNQLPPGDHWLTVTVTPRAIDPATGDWYLRLQLVQQFPDGHEQVLRAGDWYSAIDTAVLGQPVERTMVLPIQVTAGAG